MRLEWETRPSSGSLGIVATALYAGNKRVSQKMEQYEKADWAVWRISALSRSPILRYPYEVGQHWTVGKGKSEVEFLIVGSSLAVTSRAGQFSGCIKVREKDARFATSWKYDYYCPGVGRVKTTVGGPGFEKENTELMTFGKIP